MNITLRTRLQTISPVFFVEREDFVARFEVHDGDFVVDITVLVGLGLLTLARLPAAAQFRIGRHAVAGNRQIRRRRSRPDADIPTALLEDKLARADGEALPCGDGGCA